MAEVKTFKLEQKINNVEELYKYLIKNVEFVSDAIGIKIQKPLKEKPFCLIGEEEITQRNILFFASKNKFIESLGELIIMAGAFDADIVVFFLPELNRTYLESLNWLEKICNDDTQFIVGEIN